MAQLKVDEVEAVNRVVARDRMYLDSSGEKLVAEGDANAASLFAAEGDEISREDAVRYGLVKPTAEEKKALAADSKDGE
jgi:hypothetical protein